ncbi:MAG: magnesium transporter [Bacteroidales bacterium]|nr:magnesium transporter [Bacteroidales bacterium]
MASKFELTREFVDELRELIKIEGSKAILNLVEDLHPADLAEVFEILSLEEARYIYLIIDKELAADTLTELEENDREKLLNSLPSETIAKDIIDKMESDDAADLIGELPENKKAEILKSIDDVDQAIDIVDLLNYDEDTAGGLMAKELIQVNINWDMVTCIKEMRIQAEEVDELYYVYVVDDDGMLLGTVSLKRLMLARSNAKIKNIYDSDIISVGTDMDSEEVAKIMEKYDLVALPVVDPIGRLIGRITIDDVVDVIKEEAEKDYQLASGITADVESSDSVFTLLKARVPWLFIGLLGGVFAAFVLEGYEEGLKQYSTLYKFIPLIIAMGGNVGVQSSSIVVQGLANKSIDLDSTFKKILKELSIAFMVGLMFAVLIFIFNFFINPEDNPIYITLSISVALFTVMSFASIFGTFTPMLLNKLKIDPAIATGPFITTANDILGIILYMLISFVIINLFIG